MVLRLVSQNLSANGSTLKEREHKYIYIDLCLYDVDNGNNDITVRELRAKVCYLSTKVEKLGKLDTKLKSAFYACQTLDDLEHLVCLVICFVPATCLYHMK